MDLRNSKKRLLERVNELEERIERVYDAGKNGISHVGRANYADREYEANEWIDEAMYGDK
jgi:hypothetical protein